jgi:hypothetical protein
MWFWHGWIADRKGLDHGYRLFDKIDSFFIWRIMRLFLHTVLLKPMQTLFIMAIESSQRMIDRSCSDSFNLDILTKFLS